MMKFVEEGLKKVRSKEWAEPLGKALRLTGKIVESCAAFGPGANLIGAALSFGSTLLNPDLLKSWAAFDPGANLIGAAVNFGDNQLNPEPSIQELQKEIKKEFGDVKVTIKRILKEVVRSNNMMREQMAELKDLISKTFQIVTDIRYKVRLVSI